MLNPFIFYSWRNGDRKMPILPQENKKKSKQLLKKDPLV